MKTSRVVSFVAVVFLTGCGQNFNVPPDVDSGRVAGLDASLSAESMAVQEALIVLGAAFSEIIANSDVRAALGQSIATDPFAPGCITSTTFFATVNLDFSACTGGGGEAMLFSMPIPGFGGATMIEFGDATADPPTGIQFRGYTISGSTGLAPVEGVPLTYLLTGDPMGTGEISPIVVSNGTTSVELFGDLTVSIRLTGPSVLLWGTGTGGASNLIFHLGEPGTTDATGNPPSWESPISTCGCPTKGQTSLESSLTVSGLIMDLDLLVDGDGFGTDDFATFPMDIDDLPFDQTSANMVFEETCGTYTASFGSAEPLALVVSKQDILAAIQASPLPDSEKSDQIDTAKARLKDEITLHINSDVLATSAQEAFANGFNDAVCMP